MAPNNRLASWASHRHSTGDKKVIVCWHFGLFFFLPSTWKYMNAMVVPKRAVNDFAQAASEGQARGFALGGFQLFIYCRLLNISCGRFSVRTPPRKNKAKKFLTFVSAFQLIVPVFLIFQYLINLVPGRSRVPSGRFSSRKAAVMAGTTRGQGRFGRLGRQGENSAHRMLKLIFI